MAKRIGACLVFGIFVACGNESAGDPPNTESSTATSTATTSEVPSANTGETSAAPSGILAPDDTALVDCTAPQAPCNQKCLSPGESSQGCNHLAFVDTGSYTLQGFEVADNIYVGLVGVEAPDVIRAFDKTSGANKYEVAGAGGSIQQLAATETHLGWTENQGGMLNLYAVELGETQATLLYSVLGLTDVSAIATGWLVPDNGRLLMVPADGAAPQELSIEGEGLDELPMVERAGTLYYRTASSFEPDKLWSAPLSGGEPTLVTEAERIDGFYVDESHVYLIDSDGSTQDPRYLARVPLSGGIPERLGEPLTTGVVFDFAGYGDALYTTQSERADANDASSPYVARLLRLTKSTGARTVIAVTEHDVSNVIADATGVYFTRFAIEGQAIMKVQ